MKIITLGPIGTFSYHLTKKQFKTAHIDCVSTIESIFSHISSYDKAVIPIENDVSGFVQQSIEHLMTCEYSAERLLEMPISYNLVGFGPLEKIHTLFTFPYTFTQCQKTLSPLLPHVELLYTSSNGMSAQELANAKSEGYAAILPSYTGASDRFPILHEGVQDCSTNTTRFLVLTKHQDKTSRTPCCFLFSRKTTEDVAHDLKERTVYYTILKQVPMEGISCHCYFVVFEGTLEDLEGYDVKLLGYLHENA